MSYSETKEEAEVRAYENVVELLEHGVAHWEYMAKQRRTPYCFASIRAFKTSLKDARLHLDRIKRQNDRRKHEEATTSTVD